ncbi:MAG: hypothetical protein M1338_04580, partial [Patescibacteria group bacterium]|nr:hypothetical protein [Patescibacteria group bacterium]
HIENITNGMEILTTLENEKDIKLTKNYEIIIFCDSIRKFKIRIFASVIINCITNIADTKKPQVIIKGINFHRSLREKIRQVFTSTVEILSLIFPKIEEIIVERRKKQWGIKD